MMKRGLFFVLVFALMACFVLGLAACGEEDEHQHTFSSEWTSDDNNHWHVATCEHTEEISDLAPHEMDAGTVITPATETTPGEMKYTCTVCGKVKIVVIPALGVHTHTFYDAWTYDEDSHWHAASCGHTEEKSGLAPHTWDNGTVITPATETTPGTMLYECSVCHKTKEVEIPPTSLTHTHTFETEWTSDESSHWHIATCAHTTEVSGLDLHTWDEGVIITPATETTAGEKKFTCTVCGAVMIEQIPPTDALHTHTYEDAWTTNDDAHWHAATCAHTTEVSDLAPHTFDGGTVVLQATDTEPGQIRYVCTVCAKVVFVEIPIGEHIHTFDTEWTSDATAHWHSATCIHTTETADYAAHTWDSGTVIKEATAKENGEIKYICSVCGANKIEEIPATRGVEITVGYELNGGAWAAGDTPIDDYSVLYVDASSIVLTEQEPVYDEYVFAGWNVQISLADKMAKVTAVWLGGLEGITDENGDSITAKNAALNKDGIPTVIPQKAPGYFDANRNGVQDEGEPVEHYAFDQWKRSIGGVIILIPAWQTYSVDVTVRFDFNGGYPASSPNGTTFEQPYGQTAAPVYYYQDKIVTFSQTGQFIYSVFNGKVFEDSLRNATIAANTLDISAYNGMDQVSIPVRPGYEFVGWAVSGRNAANQLVIHATPGSSIINGHSISYNTWNHNFYVSGLPNSQSLTYYAQWKETSSPPRIKLTLGFDFNGGFPSVVMNGTNPADLMSSAQIWETGTLDHYYQSKGVYGIHIPGTLTQYAVSVSDDPYSCFDGIGIPVCEGYVFIGWGLSHSASVVMYTNTYTFTYDTTDPGTLVTLYAQWFSEDNIRKARVVFIEDSEDYSTADGEYYSNMGYGNSPAEGIFYQDNIAFTSPVSQPVPGPGGGFVGDTYWAFSHWTQDPVSQMNVNVFANGPVLASTLEYTYGGIYAYVEIRFYAVYKAVDRDEAAYHGNQEVQAGGSLIFEKMPIEAAQYGRYLMVMNAPSTSQDSVNVVGHNTGIKVISWNEATQSGTPAPLTYWDAAAQTETSVQLAYPIMSGVDYYFIFEIAAGDTVMFEPFAIDPSQPSLNIRFDITLYYIG